MNAELAGHILLGIPEACPRARHGPREFTRRGARCGEKCSPQIHVLRNLRMQPYQETASLQMYSSRSDEIMVGKGGRFIQWAQGPSERRRGGAVCSGEMPGGERLRRGAREGAPAPGHRELGGGAAPPAPAARPLPCEWRASLPVAPRQPGAWTQRVQPVLRGPGGGAPGGGGAHEGRVMSRLRPGRAEARPWWLSPACQQTSPEFRHLSPRPALGASLARFQWAEMQFLIFSWLQSGFQPG